MVTNVDRFNLAHLKPATGLKPSAPAKPGLKIDLGTKDSWSGSDDYARRHREAFDAKEPPKAPKTKIGLGFDLSDSTRVNLKPGLKKFKVELKIKF